MVRCGLSLLVVLATVGLVASETLPRLFPSTVSFRSSLSSSNHRNHRSHNHHNKHRHSHSFKTLSYHSQYYSDPKTHSPKTTETNPKYPSYPNHVPSLSTSKIQSTSEQTPKTAYPNLSTLSYHTPNPNPLPLTGKSSRFVVVSEGMYDHNHHIHDHERRKERKERKRRPYFATGNTTWSSVFLGNTVTLDCTVHDMTNESVSWMRSRDDVLELITWDSNTYANDDRYSLVRERGKRWRRWQLVIRNSRSDDEGQYRCQVATQPPLILEVNLSVTVPVARVVDERGTKVQEKHYNSGSMIELKCIVEKVPFPHGPVTWRRGSTILTYNTSRGGVSVKGNEAGGFIRSRLYVADATPHDSGLYSCWYKNITSDTVTVHVIAGENSAAMQHDGLPGSAGTTNGAPSMRPLGALPFLIIYIASLITCRSLPLGITFSSLLGEICTKVKDDGEDRR